MLAFIYRQFVYRMFARKLELAFIIFKFFISCALTVAVVWYAEDRLYEATLMDM